VKRNILVLLSSLFLLGLVSNAFAIPTVTIIYPNDTGTYVGPITNIDFNLNADGNQFAGDQNIDINYSTSTTQGTGTVIINDGNFSTTTGLSCGTGADQNLNTPITCRYVWDSQGLPNGGYYILIEDMNVEGDTAFDASDNFFQRGNDYGIVQSEFDTFSFYFTLFIMAIMIGAMAMIVLPKKGA